MRWTTSLSGWVVCLALVVSQPATAAGKRLALLVGNNTYAEVPPLNTAVNDVRATRTALERLGFTVETVENGTKRQISRALAKVEGSVEPGDAVLFHFAGHGFEIDGQNWLLPIDVPAAKQGESGLVKDESFNAADVIERFRAKGAGTVVAILDACRDNPFAQAGGTRALGGGRGLARMDASGGVFIIFSAGAKQQALDRLSPEDPVQTSIFARTFLPLLGDGRLTLIDLAKETQERVRTMARSIGHEQLPAYYDGVVGRITVTGEVATESAQPRMQATSSAPPVSGEDLFWRSVETRDDPGSYRAYLAEVERGAFPGTYRRLAELRLAAAPARPEAPSAPARITPGPSPREATSPEIEACDRAAASPSDSEKPANIAGVDFKDVSGQAAVTACRKAIEVKDAPRRVFFQLGRAFSKIGNAREGVVYYVKASELRHPIAMHNLAILHNKGEGVRRDPGLARTLFEAAAAAGIAQSYHEIGAMYDNGNGVGIDYAKARFYYEKAASLGAHVTYANLGNLYMFGRGVPRSKETACRYYREGANAGDPTSTKNMNGNCRVR